MAEWLCSGLQSRQHRFDSGPSLCPGGGTGRRKGLKIPREQSRAGSIPAPGNIMTNLQIPIKTLIWLAYRQLFSVHKHAFVAFVQRSATVSLAISVVVLTVVMSVFAGFQQTLSDWISQVEPHLSLSMPVNDPKQHQAVINWLWADQRTKSVKSSVQAYGLLIKQPPQPLLIQSVDGWSPSSDKQERLPVMLSAQFAHALGLSVGDSFSVYALGVKANDKNPYEIKTIRLVVSSINDLTSESSGLPTIVVPQKALLKRLGMESTERTDVAVSFKDASDIMPMIDKLAKAFPEVMVNDLSRQVLVVQESLGLQKQMMFIVLGLIVLMGVFNLSTSLVLLVKERENEIALQRTLGFSRFSIYATVLLQGLIIVSTAIILGLMIGLPLAINLGILVQWVESWLGYSVISQVMIFSHLPTQLNAKDLVIMIISIYFMALIFLLSPARQASAIHPADKLRYE